MSAGRRLLFYSHNGVGIGHVQRQLRLAAGYRARHPDVGVLIVTGSHAAGSLDFPPGVDYLKLPSIRMVDRYRTWEPRDVGVAMETMTRMRSELVRDAVRRFRPHLMVVDFMPAGPYGELLPALEELSRRGGRAVAGFRDIIDEPRFVAKLWRQTGVVDVLKAHYSAVCVYGDATVADFADYGLGGVGAPALHYLGYLVQAPSGKLPAQGRGPAPLIVATTGGGVDGGPLLERFVQARARVPGGGTWVAVAGPLLGADEFASLRRAGDAAGVRVLRTVTRLGALLAHADVVVSMAGYNTACELLACRTPAVVVPATRESLEQRLRARVLAGWGRAFVLDTDRCSPAELADAIAQALRSGPPPAPPVPLDGMSCALDLFDCLASAERGATPGGRA